MRRVPKARTWTDNWNNVIRDVIFPDAEMRELMMLPKNVTITQFIDKYFLEDEGGDEILTDEAVRICWYDSKGNDTGNSNVRLKFKEFDIYVKKEHLHDVTMDRLQNRYNLICDRLKYLLLRDEHVYGLHFEYEDEYNLYTKTIGYKRYHLDLFYFTSI